LTVLWLFIRTSVEAGRGVALVQEGFDCLTGPRLKVRPLTGGSDEMFRGRRIGIFAIRDAHNEVRRRGREGEVGVRLGRFAAA